MGAVAAAVLGAPISTILIVFEITGDYGVTIAVMIAVAVATVVIQKIPGKSFFHWQLERRGVNINRDRLHDLLQSITARETMIDAARLRERHGGEGIMETGTEVSPGALVVGVDDNVESILMIMERHGVEHIAVIDHGEPRRVVGMVSRADILAIHNRALVANHD
jgi:CIC family chloride channel protein